jgi:nitrate reductase gamma subunit
MTFFIGAILPFLTIIIFIAGLIYRIYVWKKLPRPTMTLTPAPKPGAGRFLEEVKEIFLFKSLFKGDKSLWIFSWIFHISLAFIFLGHLRVFAFLPDKILLSLGMTSSNINAMSSGSGGVAGIIILAAILILLVRRFAVKRVRDISQTGDYFALILLIAIIITGDIMRFSSTHFELSQTREYFAALFTFTAIKIPQNPWFMAHFFLAQCLIIYLPFSKILHFGGVFFTEALIHRH